MENLEITPERPLRITPNACGGHGVRDLVRDKPGLRATDSARVPRADMVYPRPTRTPRRGHGRGSD